MNFRLPLAISCAFVVLATACGGGQPCASNAECAAPEQCFLEDTGNGGICRVPEGAIAATLAIRVGPAEANDLIDATIAWTITGTGTAGCALLANGEDTGADIAAGALAVSITETTTYDLACADASDSLTLVVHSLGAIEGPTAVLLGTEATFTFAVADVVDCVLLVDGESPQAVPLVDGKGSFTDVVTSDRTYTVACSGVGARDLVREHSVAAVPFEVVTPSPLVVPFEADAVIEIVASDDAVCALVSREQDGSDEREEEVADVRQPGARTLSFPATETRTLVVECSAAGLTASATLELHVRPVVSSFDAHLATVGAEPAIAFTWTIRGQQEGSCSFATPLGTVDAPATGFIDDVGLAQGGRVDYRLLCSAESDATGTGPELVAWWGDLLQQNVPDAWEQLAEVELVPGQVSLGAPPPGQVVTLAALREVSARVSVLVPTTSPPVALLAPSLVSVGGVLQVQAQRVKSITAPQLESVGGLSVGGTAFESLDMPSLTTVRGTVGVAFSPTLDVLQLPALTAVEGSFDLLSVDLPQLQLPALTTIGSSFSVRFATALTTISAPALESVGDDFRIQDSPKVRDVDFSSLTSMGANGEFVVEGFIFDGIGLECVEIVDLYCPLTTRDQTPSAQVTIEFDSGDVLDFPCDQVRAGC